MPPPGPPVGHLIWAWRRGFERPREKENSFCQLMDFMVSGRMSGPFIAPFPLSAIGARCGKRQPGEVVPQPGSKGARPDVRLRGAPPVPRVRRAGSGSKARHARRCHALSHPGSPVTRRRPQRTQVLQLIKPVDAQARPVATGRARDPASP